jgi:hypothetical protein
MAAASPPLYSQVKDFEVIFEGSDTHLYDTSFIKGERNGRFLFRFTSNTASPVDTARLALSHDGGYDYIADGRLFPTALDSVELDPSGQVYVYHMGTIRRYLGGFAQSLLVDNSKTWQDLGKSGTWPSDSVVGFSMASTTIPEQTIFAAYMYANQTVGVVRRGLTNASVWESLSFPDGSTWMQSSTLQSPVLSVGRNGSIYLTVIDRSCSTRNASMLSLAPGAKQWTFVGQRCFCDAVSAQVAITNDTMDTVFVVDMAFRNIWRHTNAVADWELYSARFATDSFVPFKVAVKTNSTLIGFGSVHSSGLGLTWFNPCTNRWEVQVPFTNEFTSIDGGDNLRTSLSPDGTPYILQSYSRNPAGLAKPYRLLQVLTFRGEFPLAGHVQCVPCPGSSVPSASGSNSVCTSCLPGFQPTSSGGCSSCGVGAWSQGGNAACTCVPGFVSASADQGCIKCIRYDVSSATGSTSCTTCPTLLVPSANHTSCDKCPAGTYVSPSYVSDYSCRDCGVGFYSPSPGMTSCVACPAETYTNRSASSSCTPCPAGTSNRGATGQSSVTSCIPCSPGTYGANAGSTCAACPSGTFSQAAGTTECTPCPAGTANPEVGQTKCQNCSVGDVGATGRSTCSSRAAATSTSTVMLHGMALVATIILSLWL